MIKVTKDESIDLRSKACGKGFIVNKVAAHPDRELFFFISWADNKDKIEVYDF